MPESSVSFSLIHSTVFLFGNLTVHIALCNHLIIYVLPTGLPRQPGSFQLLLSRSPRLLHQRPSWSSCPCPSSLPSDRALRSSQRGPVEANKLRPCVKAPPLCSPRDPTRNDAAILGVHPQQVKAGTRTDICTPILVATLFPIAKRCEQPKCPLTGDRGSEMRSARTHDGTPFSLGKEGNSGTPPQRG